MMVQAASKPDPAERLRTWAEFEINYLKEPAIEVGGCPLKFAEWEKLGTWPTPA